MSFNLKNQTYLVMGVANNWSIAWGIAQSLDKFGATLIFSSTGERSIAQVEKLRGQLGEQNQNALIFDTDVSQDQPIVDLFAAIKEKNITLTGVAHCIAFSNKENLKGDYYEVGRSDYLLAQDISSYSLTAVVREAEKSGVLAENASFITLSYLGGERAVENYNVMGVAKAALEASVKYLAGDIGKLGHRINTISAGPIRTVSGRAVGGFSKITELMEERAPLHKATNIAEVGDTAVYLLSDMSRGVTGEIIHVDGGFHSVGF